MRWLAGRTLSITAIAVVVVLLGACAGTREYQAANAAFDAGKFEEGNARLEAAVKAEPGNARYRIALSTRRAAMLNDLNSRAEQFRRAGRLGDAEKLFRQALGVDPGNGAAQSGMEAIAAERNHRALVQQAEPLLKKGDARSLEEAAALMRRILAENPQHRDAKSLQSQIVDAQAKRARPAEIRLAAAFRKPITLEFRDAPLRSVFDVVSRVSGLSFFFDKDVRTDQRTTILARDTSIEDAVRILLTTNQLEQKVLNETSLLIYPNNPQKLREYQALSIRSFYLANADVRAVSNTLRTILKTRDLVTDERLGIIIMRDTPEAIQLAERIIQLQDMADSEVMLEVEVLEVKRSRLLELGIKWPQQASFSILNTTEDRLTLEGLRNLNSRSVGVTLDSAVINARKDDTDSNILANPRIRVRNRDKARIVIGDRVPVITTTATSTGFVSDSVSYLDVGLRVEVEPTIFLDDEVAIKVALEVSNLVREVTSRSGTLSYQVGTRNASTVLRLRDGETQILAGLINQEDRSSANKVPGFGDFPLLGRLFSSRKDDSQSTEIVLSITPRILRSVRRPDLVAAEFAAGTEASLGSRGLSIGGADAAPSPSGGPQTAPTPTAPSGAGSTPTSTSNPPASATTTRSVTPGTTTPAPTSTVTPPPPTSAVTPPPPTSAATPPGSQPPSASTSPSVGAVPGPQQSYVLQGPRDVKAGEQFSLVLRLQSVPVIRGLPIIVGFDTAALQLANVVEGDFFKQGGAQTTFSSRVDPVQGRAFIAVVRQGTTGQDPGTNGDASLVTLVFRAVRAADNVRVQLVSATPDPAPPVASTLPIDFFLNIRQP